MHKVCDYHFQIHRKNGQRAILRKEMAIFGNLQLGVLAQQINCVLSEVVVYPNLVNRFSLVCVEHQNKNTCGYFETRVNIPGTILRFHFILDKILPTTKVMSDPKIRSTRLLRQHVAVSKIENGFFAGADGGTLLTIAFSAVELGDNYSYFSRTQNSLFLVYSIIGMTTKADRMFGGKRRDVSEHFGTVLSTNAPKDYYKCLMVWRRYPNLLLPLNLEEAEYVLENIQPLRKLTDSGNRIISGKQKADFGISAIDMAEGRTCGLIYWIFSAIEDTLFGRETNNRCLIICFDNFNTSAKSVFELANMLWSVDKASAVRKIHTIIWSRT